MAFILAVVIAVGSLAIGVLGLMADSMSDAPGQTSGVGPIVVIGLIIAALVAASHWMPNISW